MNMSLDALRDFRRGGQDELLRVLESRQILPRDEAEAAVYALADIAESVEKVYCELIPKILSDPDAAVDVIKDLTWDVREEFRHIDYHIHDGRLTEL